VAPDIGFQIPGECKDMCVVRGAIPARERGRVRWRRLNAEALAAAEAWIGDRRRLWNARLEALDRHLRAAPATSEGQGDEHERDE
jgi:hypothetical protein